MKIIKFKNKLIDLSIRHYYILLEKELKNCVSVLDVGCGNSSPLMYVKKIFYSEGVDIFGSDIAILKKKRIHDKYKTGNVLDIDKIYKHKKFDAVVCLDVIEHLTKKQGFELLKKMENLAKKKIIVVTPNGFVSQTANENPYQEHISGWKVKEFRAQGYKLYGMRGVKYILGEHASLKYKPWLIWGIISVLSQFVVYYIPSYAFELMAVKNKTNNKTKV